jgi:hypothetical protein
MPSKRKNPSLNYGKAKRPKNKSNLPSLKNVLSPVLSPTKIIASEPINNAKSSPIKIKNCESEKIPQVLSGRRIIDIGYFLEGLKKLGEHNKSNELFDCKLEIMEFQREIKLGANSKLYFKCKMCNYVGHCFTNRPKIKKNKKLNSGEVIEDTIKRNMKQNVESRTGQLHINYLTNLATTSIGAGYSQLEEFLSILHIPCMSNDTYLQTQERLNVDLIKAAEECCKEAAEIERASAIENGNVDKGK